MSVVPAPTRLSGEGGGGDAPASSPGGAPTAAITASSTPALTPSSDAALEEIMRLVALLPPPVAAALASRPDCADVLEVVMDVGRPPLARDPSGDVRLSPSPITPADLEGAVTWLGDFGYDNRADIDAALHRVSALRSRRRLFLRSHPLGQSKTTGGNKQTSCAHFRPRPPLTPMCPYI